MTGLYVLSGAELVDTVLDVVRREAELEEHETDSAEFQDHN